jgi:hypothetical protein
VEVELTAELKRPRASEIRRSSGGAVIVDDVGLIQLNVPSF